MRGSSAAPFEVLTEREVKLLRAIGQALFPRDKHVGVDALDVGVASYIDAWLARCGTTERAQFHALVQAVAAGFPVWARDPSARLEAARLEDRRAYIESWERSQTYVQRMLWEGLRGMFLFAYVDAPDVKRAIGQHPSEDAVTSQASGGASPEEEAVANAVGGGYASRSAPRGRKSDPPAARTASQEG